MQIDLTEVDAWSVQDAYTRDVIHKTWERLPVQVRRALRGLRFTEDAAALSAKKAYADAGVFDIRVRPFGLVSEQAAISVILHECAHVYLQHPQQLRAGLKSVAVVEAEADALVRGAWGFDKEMEDRRRFFGK